MDNGERLNANIINIQLDGAPEDNINFGINADTLGGQKPEYYATAEDLAALNDSKLSMELLWENASPTSEFAAQTIPIDSSNSPAALVEFIYLGSDKMISVFVKKESGAICFAPSAVNTTRSFTFDSAGIHFNDAIQYTSYNVWSNTTSNSDCIPVRIYGVKGVPA